MITLNGTKFARNNSEFVDSLFDKGGTCSGYYKVNKCSVSILDHNKNKVGVIANNVLGKATKVDGKYWYSYGEIDLIGQYTSSAQGQEEVRAISNRFNLPIKY